jgi:uncharacterized membrane protein
MQTISEQRSIGEILGDLSRDTAHLVRQEVALARTEIKQKVTEASRDLTGVVGGGLMAYAGALAVSAAVILMLVHLGIAAWLAALLVGVILVFLGIGMVRAGLQRLKQVDFAPHRTMATLHGESHWAKEQLQ